MQALKHVAVAFVVGLSAFFVGPMPDRAESAVRLCKSSTSSGLQAGRTEIEARAQAVSAWITAASAHGERYAAWRVAIDKTIACSPKGDGGFHCLAKAAPCTISQVPPGTFVPYKKPGVDG